MDFHAWFEAYLGGRWYTFDARHNIPRIGRVTIGRGRDAVDVALSTAYGSAALTSMIVWADEIADDQESAALPQTLPGETVLGGPDRPAACPTTLDTAPSTEQAETRFVAPATLLTSSGVSTGGGAADDDE